MLLLHLAVEVLLGSREHQLDAVQLVYFRCTRIVINRGDIGIRINTADCLDDALSHDVIRQAAERLDTDDVLHTMLEKTYHLTGQEPALAGLIADRDDRLSVFHCIINIRERIESLRFLQRCIDRL